MATSLQPQASSAARCGGTRSTPSGGFRAGSVPTIGSAPPASEGLHLPDGRTYHKRAACRPHAGRLGDAASEHGELR